MRRGSIDAPLEIGAVEIYISFNLYRIRYKLASEKKLSEVSSSKKIGPINFDVTVFDSNEVLARNRVLIEAGRSDPIRFDRNRNMEVIRTKKRIDAKIGIFFLRQQEKYAHLRTQPCVIRVFLL